MHPTFSPLLAHCRAVFEKKLLDYGPTWLVFRRVSLADQIFIKLCRLRALEESPDTRKIEDTPQDEYYGIINYCLIGLMKDEGQLPEPDTLLHNPELLSRLMSSLLAEDILARYDAAAARALSLLERKNHDYGEAWRGMAAASITDQMLIKILRIKHMLGSGRKLHTDDDLPAQLMDILNYCLFALSKGDPNG